MRDDQVLLGHEDSPCARPPLLLPSLGSVPPLGSLGALGMPPYYYYPYFSPTNSNPLSQFNPLPQLSALSAASLSSLSSTLASSLASSLMPSPLHGTSAPNITSAGSANLRHSAPRSSPSPPRH